MTDLAKGVIDLGEVVVTKDTTREELVNAYRASLYSTSTNQYVRFRRVFSIDGTLFSCLFWFNETGIIEFVRMTPGIDYESADGDRVGQQAERRAFCDQWLALRLGNPHENNEEVTAYNFKTCRVSAFSNFPFGKEEGYDAGCIFVRFSR